jgi:hypothetical protein
MKSLNLASFAEKPLDYSVCGLVFGAFGGSIAKNFHGFLGVRSMEIRVAREKIGSKNEGKPIQLAWIGGV